MSVNEEKQPNLRWSRLAKSEPPEYYRDGRVKIDLPKAEEVKNGFYSDDPLTLKRLSGGNLIDFHYKEQLESDLPPNFPMREVLRGLNINYETVKAMTFEQLVSLPKIGKVTAQEILDYKPPVDNDDSSEDGGEE